MESSPLLIQSLQEIHERLARIERKVDACASNEDVVDLDRRQRKTESSMKSLQVLAGILSAGVATAVGKAFEGFGWPLR